MTKTQQIKKVRANRLQKGMLVHEDGISARVVSVRTSMARGYQNRATVVELDDGSTGYYLPSQWIRTEA